MMNKFLVVIIFSLFQLLIITNPTFAYESTTYWDEDSHYRIEIPKGWESVPKSKFPPFFKLMISSYKHDYLSIFQMQLPDKYINKPFDKFSQAEIEEFIIAFIKGAEKANPNYAYERHGKLVINGQAFLWFLFNDTSYSYHAQIISYCTLRNGIMYQFIFGFPTMRIEKNATIIAAALRSLSFY